MSSGAYELNDECSYAEGQNNDHIL